MKVVLQSILYITGHKFLKYCSILHRRILINSLIYLTSFRNKLDLSKMENSQYIKGKTEIKVVRINNTTVEIAWTETAGKNSRVYRNTRSRSKNRHPIFHCSNFMYYFNARTSKEKVRIGRRIPISPCRYFRKNLNCISGSIVDLKIVNVRSFFLTIIIAVSLNKFKSL